MLNLALMAGHMKVSLIRGTILDYKDYSICGSTFGPPYVYALSTFKSKSLVTWPDNHIQEPNVVHTGHLRTTLLPAGRNTVLATWDPLALSFRHPY